MANNSTAQPSLPLAGRLERWAIATLGGILFFLPLFFWIATHDQFELPKLTLLRLFSVVLAGLWAASQALKGELRWRRSPLDLPLLAWSAWLLFKTLHSVSPYVSWRGEYENFAGSLTQLNYSLLFYMTIQLLRSTDSARRLLLVFELSCVCVGMYGIFQALRLDFISWSASSVVTDRYFASMGNPNFMGALMIMGLALVIARAVHRDAVPEKKILWGQWVILAGLPLLWLGFYLFFPPGHTLKLPSLGQKGAQTVIAIYIAGLAVLALLIKAGRARNAQDLALALESMVLFKAMTDTGTRGAFAGLLATIAFFSFLALIRRWQAMKLAGHGRLRRLTFSAATLAALFAALTAASFAMGPELSRRMKETLADPLKAFDSARLNIWGPALNMSRDFPLTGTGVDTFKTVFPQYAFSRFAHFDGENVASRNAHSEPLQVLATMGSIGLLLWFWLIGAWALAWWQRYQTSSTAETSLLLGLGGLFSGYLVQNLVSFGVSAITAPLFICMGLLWAGQELPQWRKNIFKVKTALLAAIFPVMALTAWAATAVFRADLLYNFGHLVSSQNKILDQAPLQDCRNAAQYALTEIDGFQAVSKEMQKKEAEFWLTELRKLEASPPRNASEEQALMPIYRRGAKALLLLLSTLKQEKAVAICNSEVKYQIYLGLAYEELFKLSAIPEFRNYWYQHAEKAYARGSAMNPRNAYYHGNLGRLYSEKADEGDSDSLAKAEKKYFDAVALAPSTRLFYENLILLYAQNGMGEAGLKLLAPLETREPILCGQLSMSMGTTFYQWAENKEVSPEKKALLKDASLKALEKAARLDPSNADVPYVTGVIYLNEKNRKLAKEYILKALAINPRHDLAQKFISANRL